MQYPDDLIQVVFIYRKLGISRAGHQLDQLFQGGIGFHSLDFGTRDHHLAYQQLSQVKNGMQHLVFRRLDNPSFFGII